MKELKAAAAICSLALLSGCATITSDTMQSVSVTAETQDGEKITQVACELENDKGNWTVEAPGFVSVHRSAEDLVVECKKEEMEPGHLKAVSRAAGGMWGNIIFGGGIGAIIDHNKGTGYNYPDILPVKMGDSVLIDRKEQDRANNPETAATTEVK
jgi:uncharacterized protein YceK